MTEERQQETRVVQPRVLLPPAAVLAFVLVAELLQKRITRLGKGEKRQYTQSSLCCEITQLVCEGHYIRMVDSKIELELKFMTYEGAISVVPKVHNGLTQLGGWG